MAGKNKANIPVIEKGIVAGNFYNKYETRNPISRYLMDGFYRSVTELVSLTNVTDVHEVGCGEGYLSVILADENKRVRASDFSRSVIEKAKDISKQAGKAIPFQIASVYDLTPEKDSAELIVCCEVLEHLEDPQSALQVLSSLANPYLLVSVPREPLWRILNMARFKYIGNLGNTPGHVQHWSRKSFLDMLKGEFEVIKVLSPLPWTMALCRIEKS